MYQKEKERLKEMQTYACKVKSAAPTKISAIKIGCMRSSKLLFQQ